MLLADKQSVAAVLALLVPLLMTPTRARAWVPTYSAVDLGTDIDPFGIDSAGQLAGIIYYNNQYEQPFVTIDGNLKPVDALHSDDSGRAVAINSAGVAVGYSCIEAYAPCSAVTWVAGGAPKAFAVGFSPAAINDAGEIVGQLGNDNSSGITSPSGVAVWRNGVFSPLPFLSQPQGGSAGAEANAINGSGAIAGELYLIGADNVITGYAVEWIDSQIQNLGANAAAKGINDQGQVVGFSGNDAALWTHGVLTDLGNLGGFTVAYGINNSGVIVGTANLPYDSANPTAISAAVVWIDGVMYQLTNLVQSALPHNVQLQQAHAVNESGQIVASGYDPVEQQFHAYLLSPVAIATAAAPTFSVLPRTYATSQTLTLADATPAATIHYTLDGTTPTTQSAIYTTALTISHTTTVKAIAGVAGYHDSAVASATYTIAASSAAIELNLSPFANVQAIGPLGSRAHEGPDGYRNMSASELMGKSLYWSGVQFNFVDSASANGVAAATLSLPAGRYSTLKLLGTSTRGNRNAETFIVTYTDGSSSNFVQGMSDWLTPQSYSGESTALTMDHRIEHSGTASAGPYHLYGYSFSLNSTKTVRSLTLPNSGYVVVLAGGLIPSQ